MLKNILKNKHFYYFTFFVIVMVILNVEIIHSPYLVAEDGQIFFNQYFDYGIFSFVLKYGGYLNSLSRLITYISYLFGFFSNSFVIMIRAKITICIIIECLILTYFTTDHFDFLIPNKKYRFLVAILLETSISCFAWMFYSQTSIHWWCGLYCFLFSLQLINNYIPSKIYRIIACLFVVSSISSLIILFAIIYYCYKYKDGKTKLLPIVFFSIVQIIFIIFVKDINSCNYISAFNISHVLTVIDYSFKSLISSFNFVLGTNYYFIISNLYLNLYSGIIILLILLYFIKKEYIKYLVYACICIFSLYFMIYYKLDDVPQTYYQLLTENHHLWYNCLPAIIIQIIIYTTLYRTIDTKKYLFLIFTIFIIMNNFVYSSHPEFDTNNNIHDIRNHVNFYSKKYTKVLVTPDYLNWYVYIPVKEEYCIIKENECYEKIEYQYIKKYCKKQ